MTVTLIPVQAVRREGHLLVLEQCCFCGKRHTHGSGGEAGPHYGHRVAHCVRPRDPDAARAGYFLCEASEAWARFNAVHAISAR